MPRRSPLVTAALLAALPLLLTACPDPTATKDGDASMGMKPPEGGGPPGGEGGMPPGGGPGGAGAGAGGPGGGGRPNPPGFTVTAGEGVKLSGAVSYAGAKTGTVRIDFLRQSSTAGFPELVHSITQDKPGPFEVEAPKDAGTLMIVAFLDANDNGPDPDEPAARIKEPVAVTATPVTGITLELSDNPDLGELKPGGKEGAPGGGPPPDGAPPKEGGGPGAGAPPKEGGPGAGAGAGAPPAGGPPAGGPPAGGAPPAGK